jgi:hypothetical protein
MYHPENGFPEFIEIFNSGENNVNLGGFSFIKGIDFTFQFGNNISPGNGLVLTNDTTLFQKVYGFRAFGQYRKQLSNGGETLVLMNNFSQMVDSVTYSDTIPWPLNADGDGFSLEVIDPYFDNSLVENWKASDNKKGTPFETKTVEEFDVVLYPNPFNDLIYIELGNQDLVYETFIIEIFNLFGSKVKTFEMVSNNLKFQIPTHDLSQGVYVFQIQSKQELSFEKQSFKAIKL